MRRMMTTRIWVLLLGLLIVRAGPVSAASDETAPTHALRGVVVDAVTRQPIVRALVELDAKPQRSALTGPNGEFLIEGLAAGEAYIRVRRPGYLDRPELHPGSEARKVTIASADTAVILELVPQGVVAGRVLDQDGEAIENAMVQLWHFDVINGRRILRQQGVRGTGSDGRYRIADLGPGAYYVVVQNPRAFSAPLDRKTAGYPLTYFYPGSPQWTDAAPVRVSPGQTFTVDIHLPTVPLYTVSGTVDAPAGIKNAFATAMPEVPFASERGVTVPVDPNTGAFTLPGLSNGSYRLQVTSQVDSGQPLMGSLPLLVASKSIAGVHLPLEPPAVIPVLVQMNSSRSQAGADSNNRNGGLIYPVQLRLLGSRVEDDRYAGRIGVRFAFAMVSRGEYRLECSPSESWYVAAAQQHGVDLFLHPLTVVSSGEQPAIEVTLRDDGGVIAGDIRASALPDGFSVVAVAEFAPTQSPRIVTPPEARPQFSISNLPPGSYRVFAVDRAAAIDWMDPEVLRRYPSQQVAVTPNSTSVVHLTLIRAGD
jgi:hypothetical protein